MSIWECLCKFNRLNGALGSEAGHLIPISHRFSVRRDQRFVAKSNGVAIKWIQRLPKLL